MTQTLNPELEKVIRIQLELRRRKEREAFVKKYLYDTAAFAYDLIDWDKLASRPAPYQMDIWSLTDEHDRVAVISPRGAGKTTTGSIYVIKNVIMSEVLQEEWKIVTTASVWRQLENFLWPEIHKFRKLLKWDKIPLPPPNPRFVYNTGWAFGAADTANGKAFAANSDEPELIEGAHAHRLYYLYDEAKKISERTFDACEGAFSNANNDTGQIAKALTISTPGMPEGRFWQIINKEPGYEDWKVYEVGLKDTLDAGRISAEWAEQRKVQWGGDSPMYRMHVLGKFPESSESGVIPRAWVDDAVERWHLLDDKLKSGELAPMPLTSIGMDVGGEGEDKTIYAKKYGDVMWRDVIEVPKSSRENAVRAFRALQQEIETHKDFSLTIDANGLGSSVYDMVNVWLKEENRGKLYDIALDPFVAQSRAVDDWGEPITDAFGIYKFADRRSAAWWGLREKLNPANNPTLALPPNRELIADLTAPRWKEAANSTIRVESKDELRKPTRLGRSTDVGDTVVMGEHLDYRQSSKVGFFIL